MSAFSGTLHLYSHPLTAFEFQPSYEAKAQDDDSTVIFVGGLFDNLATVALSYPVAKQLPPGWRFVQAMLSSSGIGWGTSNLDKDVEEMGKLVSYLRKLRPNGKVVLFGHSTGSQDTMHYLISELDAETRPKVDGVILQGSISDREGFNEEMDPEMLKATVKLAQDMVVDGKGEELLPRLLLKDWCPCTANRWLSLMSPGPDHAGQDDLFSSDLSEERLQGTFGKVGRSRVPLLILYSAEDQYVPSYVDREATVGKWTRIVKENGGIVHDQSGLVPGMDHSGSGASEEAKLGLARRVVAFVQSL